MNNIIIKANTQLFIMLFCTLHNRQQIPQSVNHNKSSSRPVYVPLQDTGLLSELESFGRSNRAGLAWIENFSHANHRIASPVRAVFLTMFYFILKFVVNSIFDKLYESSTIGKKTGKAGRVNRRLAIGTVLFGETIQWVYDDCEYFHQLVISWSKNLSVVISVVKRFKF